MRPLLALGLACLLCVAGHANSLEWFESARMGDWPVLERQLAAGTDINQSDYVGMTALHHALALGQGEVARQLIEHGADITKNSDEHSTWGWAVYGGNLDAFRLLLDRGQPARLDRDEIVHLFDKSISFGRITFIDELERRGFRLAKGNELDGALITAVRCEQPELTERLITLGADPNRPANTGEYPLARAALLDRTDLLDILLRHGARIDQQGADIIGNFSSMTALTTAVMADRRTAVQWLLQHGADIRALDNRAIELAELIGDPQVFTALIRAGARPSAPFAFAKWMTGAQPIPEKPVDTTTAEYWGRQLASMGVFRADNPVPDALAGRKIAVLTLDDSMADAGALLTARLSAETGATLLERDEIRRIAREKNLQAMLAAPGQERAVGRLLGADLLVILRAHRFDNESLREAKIIAVNTGIVVGTALSASKSPLEAWISEAISISGAAAPLTSASSSGIRLVSVPRVVASLNTPLGRELERQFTVTIAARLGRLPGIVVVERNDLDRLALEQDSSLANYATSSWLMDATLDVPAGSAARDLKLRVTLKTRAGADQTVDIAGTTDNPSALADQVVAQVGQIITGTPVESWNPRDEAAAFLSKARQFKQAFLWPDVASSIEAARALGLDNDDVTALRMEAAVQRILLSSQRLLDNKRKRRDYAGIAELVAYRAPLLMPVEDSRELDLQGYLDYANLALDIFAASLERPGAKMAGVPFGKWTCGEFWDAATVPLRLTEPLSYKNEYGDRLLALRARLLDLNDRAVQLARERGDAIAGQTLIGIRLRHLAHWLPEEEAFQTEARAILARALEWKPPFSAQSAWTNAYHTARDNTHKIGGRAGQAWIRLAGKLAASDNPEEHYLGTGLLGMQTFSPGLYWDAVKSLREQFPEVNRRDRGITTEVYKIGVETTDNPFVSTGLLNWYEDAFRGLLGHETWSLTYNGLWKETAWSITGQNGRYAPEFRAFMLRQALLRAETIRGGTPGGLTDVSFGESRGFTPAELDEFGNAFSAALSVSESLTPFGKQTAYAVDRARYLAKTKGPKPVEPEAVIRIVAKPIANPFVTLMPVTAEQRAGMNILMLDRNLNAARTGWNPLRRDTRVATTGERTTEYFFYRFDASGQPADIQRMPADIREKSVTNGDNLMTNDRWLVVSGMREGQDAWFAADRSHSPWRWRVFPAASTRGYLNGGVLVGDHLVYPFVHNPTGPRSGGPDEYETKGDPTFGVIDLDLTTGRETLIASSRRQPSVTPVESEQIAPYKSVWQVSPTGVVIRGKRGSSAHVYDTAGSGWTPYDAAFKSAQPKPGPTVIPPTRPGYVNVDGAEWNITYGIRRGLLPVFIPKGNRRFDIPVELPDADLSAYSDYEFALRTHERNKERANLSISWQPDGGVVGTGAGFHYWIPMEQVRDAIRATVSQE